MREDLALPDDPADRDRLRKAELALDRAWAAYALGRYTEAKDVAGVIEPQGTTPLPAAFRASWLSLFGATEARLGVRGARGRLEEALGEAARGHVPLVELEVWGRLLRNELFDGEPSRVVEWAPFARAAAARAGTGNAEIDGIEAEARRVYPRAISMRPKNGQLAHLYAHLLSTGRGLSVSAAEQVEAWERKRAKSRPS